jgi:hypothetical protein
MSGITININQDELIEKYRPWGITDFGHKPWVGNYITVKQLTGEKTRQLLMDDRFVGLEGTDVGIRIYFLDEK